MTTDAQRAFMDYEKQVNKARWFSALSITGPVACDGMVMLSVDEYNALVDEYNKMAMLIKTLRTIHETAKGK